MSSAVQRYQKRVNFKRDSLPKVFVDVGAYQSVLTRRVVRFLTQNLGELSRIDRLSNRRTTMQLSEYTVLFKTDIGKDSLFVELHFFLSAAALVASFFSVSGHLFNRWMTKGSKGVYIGSRI